MQASKTNKLEKLNPQEVLMIDALLESRVAKMVKVEHHTPLGDIMYVAEENRLKIEYRLNSAGELAWFTIRHDGKSIGFCINKDGAFLGCPTPSEEGVIADLVNSLK